MRLDQFPDNHEVVYRVKLGTVNDITTPLSRMENVTKRQVRRMFQKFILASPELLQRSRVEQVDEFNSQRRSVHHPTVKAEILMDLEVSFTEGQ